MAGLASQLFMTQEGRSLGEPCLHLLQPRHSQRPLDLFPPMCRTLQGGLMASGSILIPPHFRPHIPRMSPITPSQGVDPRCVLSPHGAVLFLGLASKAPPQGGPDPTQTYLSQSHRVTQAWTFLLSGFHFTS